MEEYISIRVSTLRGDQKVPFQVFVKVGEKYILYVRQGDSFEGDRLTKLKAKKVKKMFILPGDEDSYRRYLTQNIEMAYDPNSKSPLESRAQIVHGHQQSQAEEVMENPQDAASYMRTKDCVQKYIEFLSKESAGLRHILSIANSDLSVSHHCVTVSTVAVALAQTSGLPPEQIKMLALGCLMHDIDHYRNGLQGLNRLPVQMAEAEKNRYFQHPAEGARLVKDLKHFDSPVIKIILQHEEVINGMGYPQKLTEKQIDPLAIYAGIANAVDKRVLMGTPNLREAAKKLLIECVGMYPLSYFQALQGIAKSL